MVKNTEEKAIDIKNEESFQITIDDKGRYVFPEIVVYIDEKGNTQTLKIIMQKMLNMAVYNTALLKYMNDGDARAFATVVFKSMITAPAEARGVAFWDYDLEALVTVANVVTEIMGKKQNEIKRNLNLNL